MHHTLLCLYVKMVHPVINCCLWFVVGTFSGIHREMSASNGHTDDATHGECAECCVNDDSLQAIMAFMFFFLHWF